MDSEFQETTLQKIVHQVIDEVAALVSTFDGRLRFEPTTAAGQCVVTFTTAQEDVQMTIFAAIDAANLVTLSCSTTMVHAKARQTETVYQGAVDATKIRGQLSLALANWYGNVIRNLIHSTP